MPSKKSPPKTIRFHQALFWDVDPKTIDPKKHARYIIERIMDLGNDDEVRWMWQTYPKRLFKEIIIRSRALRPGVKNLWHILSHQ